MTNSRSSMSNCQRRVLQCSKTRLSIIGNVVSASRLMAPIWKLRLLWRSEVYKCNVFVPNFGLDFPALSCGVPWLPFVWFRIVCLHLDTPGCQRRVVWHKLGCVKVSLCFWDVLGWFRWGCMRGRERLVDNYLSFSAWRRVGSLVSDVPKVFVSFWILYLRRGDRRRNIQRRTIVVTTLNVALPALCCMTSRCLSLLFSESCVGFATVFVSLSALCQVTFRISFLPWSKSRVSVGMTGAHVVRRRLARIASYGNPNLTFVFCCALCRRPDDRRYNAGLRFVNIASYVVSALLFFWFGILSALERQVSECLASGCQRFVLQYLYVRLFIRNLLSPRRKSHDSRLRFIRRELLCVSLSCFVSGYLCFGWVRLS